MNKSATLLAGLVGPCPGCGNGRFKAVSDGELTNLLCGDCGACWHPEMTSVHRVDPVACPGCASRAVCEAGVQRLT
jgi:hypothetical protein